MDETALLFIKFLVGSIKIACVPAGLKCRSQITGQVTGHRSDYRPQVTGHRPQVRSQVTQKKNNRTLDKTVLD